ncbi:MAG: hypothetical protein PHN88_02560 [Ignavibacteria bacterium]|nr:hypothetical protein [Ignavibacteria bacterium]
MRLSIFIKTFLLTLFFAVITVYISGCDNNTTQPTAMTDNEYVQNVISSGYDNNYGNEDNLMSQEYYDLNNGGPVFDNDGGLNMNPVDSLYKWGRRITGVNRNYNVTDQGDTIKNVLITTTFTGNYMILAYVNGNLDTIIKPYTEVLKRNAVFKRIARTSYPRQNWRLYQVSAFEGETSHPQTGSSEVQITKVEIYKNGSQSPSYTFAGPDFTNTVFVTKYFGGTGLPQLDRNDHIQVKIYTTSQLDPVDYVAFHWAKNTYGFHRIPFALENQSGSGPYYRVYTKSFNIYGAHMLGAFNAYFSASTHESLYETETGKFASDLVGIPFKVTR